MKSQSFLIISFLIGVNIPATYSREYSEISETWLQRLDSTVAQRETYNGIKREKLNQMQTLGKGLHELSDLYVHNTKIYEECFTFDSELAMSVVDMNLQIARQLNDENGIHEWQINRSFILASTGQLLEASKAIDGLSLNRQNRKIKLQYYAQQEYLYSHLAQYSWAKWMKEDYQHTTWAYTDSIYAIMEPTDDNYLWWQSWRDYSKGNFDQAISRLQPMVDTLQLQTRRDAMLAYCLGRLYEGKGDMDHYLQYMCRSAIADLRSANKDIASLEEMASVLYEISKKESRSHSYFSSNDKSAQDLARAYTYINVCLETTKEYNNLVRTVSIARVMDDILSSYQERDSIQRKRQQWITWILAFFFMLVTCGIVMMIRQRKRLNQNRSMLQEANERLKRMNEELAAQRKALTDANSALTDANRSLNESNYVKEQYIGNVFTLCSNYISKMDEYRKNINRKCKVKLYEEILLMTDKQTLVQDELKEFYQNFDAIFLHIYPNFIEDFNKLLLPEERIEPRKGELLNTDLRIYALVRLGISDSVKIADFLHCSPQTVYNNRLKIRNKALVPKDDFAEYVRNLGRAELS